MGESHLHQIRQQQHGRNGTPTFLNMMGKLKSSQGDSVGAERYFREAVDMAIEQGYDDANDREYKKAWIYMDNVGGVLYDQGRLGDAKIMKEKALVQKDRTSGSDILFYRDAFARFVDSDGDLDVEILKGIRYYARELDDEGEVEKAQSVNEKLLSLQCRQLGENHADTICTFHELASILHQRGRSQEAQPLARKAMEGRIQINGYHNEDTVSTIHLLSQILESQGFLQESYDLCKKEAASLRHIFGSRHPQTIGRLLHNADFQLSFKYASGWDEAEALYNDALKANELQRGQSHPSTLSIMKHLIWLLWDEGKLEEAERLALDCLARHRSQYGSRHPETLRAELISAVTSFSFGNWSVFQCLQAYHEQNDDLRHRNDAVLHDKTMDNSAVMGSLVSIVLMASLLRLIYPKRLASLVYLVSKQGFLFLLSIGVEFTLTVYNIRGRRCKNFAQSLRVRVATWWFHATDPSKTDKDASFDTVFEEEGEGLTETTRLLSASALAGEKENNNINETPQDIPAAKFVWNSYTSCFGFCFDTLAYLVGSANESKERNEEGKKKLLVRKAFALACSACGLSACLKLWSFLDTNIESLYKNPLFFLAMALLSTILLTTLYMIVFIPFVAFPGEFTTGNAPKVWRLHSPKMIPSIFGLCYILYLVVYALTVKSWGYWTGMIMVALFYGNLYVFHLLPIPSGWH